MKCYENPKVSVQPMHLSVNVHIFITVQPLYNTHTRKGIKLAVGDVTALEMLNINKTSLLVI